MHTLVHGEVDGNTEEEERPEDDEQKLADRLDADAKGVCMACPGNPGWPSRLIIITGENLDAREDKAKDVGDQANDYHHGIDIHALSMRVRKE